MANINFLYDLISTQPNEDGTYHGGGKYSKKIFFELVRRNEVKVRLYGVYDSHFSVDEEIMSMVMTYDVILIDIKGRSIKEIIAENNIDKFYTALPFSLTKYGFFDLVGNDTKVIATIHGLRELETRFPLKGLTYVNGFFSKFKTFVKWYLLRSYFDKRNYKRYNLLLKNFDIVTVSNHTKYSLLSYFPFLKESVKVFYSPDVTDFTDESIHNRLELQGDYFLFVNGNRWLKNNLQGVLALDSLFSERPSVSNKVVVTGVKDKSIYLKRIKNKDRFLFLGYVPESTLRELYTNSYALVYMSLNEGFGYPPLEAMKLGVPVIASPYTSITEVCQNSVLYSNPDCVFELKNRILQLLDINIRKEFVSRGLQRYNEIKSRQDSDTIELVNYLVS